MRRSKLAARRRPASPLTHARSGACSQRLRARLVNCAAAFGLITIAGCTGPSTRPAIDDVAGARFESIVLGIAQDGGVPHVGCLKPCCVEARRNKQRLFPASLGIHDRETGRLLLIEATPAIEDQLARLHRVSGRSAARGMDAGSQGPSARSSTSGDAKATPSKKRRNPVDAVLLTHAHIGHYLGLAHFGREVASTRGLDVWVSPRMAEFLRTHGPWKQLVSLGQIKLREFTPRKAFEPLPGLRVTAIPVPHRDEFSDTMAYRIAGPERELLFVPDLDGWNRRPGIAKELLDGVDRAYVDATFYDGRELPGRNIEEIPHPPIVVTMELFGERARRAPGSLRFIHLNHTNPALRDRAIRRGIEQKGFAVALPEERYGL